MKLTRKRKIEEPARRRRDDDHKQETAEAEEIAGRTLFRRGSTLVGSLSSRVGSASELTGNLLSPRVHSHHLTKHRRRLGSYFVVVVAACMALVWFLHDFTAGIDISTSDQVAKSIDTKRYVDAINGYFAGHPFERLRSLSNISQLADYLRQTVPEVDTVTQITQGDFAASQFTLKFREPLASWLIGSKLYYVDKTGVPFEKNYFGPPAVKIVDQSGVPQVNGTVIASSQFLHFVGLAVDTAWRLYGLEVTQAIIPPDTTRQVELKLAGRDYPIKLSLDRPVGEQIEDMKKSVDYLTQKGVRPQYIDVRVSGKAYYK